MFLHVFKENKKQSLEKMIKEEEKEVVSQWLLALGIGLVPCTGALLILFYAMAKGMLFVGISLVLAVALGIAVTLSLIGILCILGRQSITRISEEKKEKKKIVIVMQYIGALLIITIGTMLFITTLF